MVMEGHSPLAMVYETMSRDRTMAMAMVSVRVGATQGKVLLQGELLNQSSLQLQTGLEVMAKVRVEATQGREVLWEEPLHLLGLQLDITSIFKV